MKKSIASIFNKRICHPRLLSQKQPVNAPTMRAGSKGHHARIDYFPKNLAHLMINDHSFILLESAR
ncbi:hypothetical protein PHSC3_001682 [Chlamydiales bacterium STE3]|nr:hypothetical protein PHSC3_001682 [Chlamydiales bacterium STE3]